MPAIPELSRELTKLLGLQHPPIGIDFRSNGANASTWTEPPVAASCVFWMRAGSQTFAINPADHHCSVGRFTHGLAEAEEIVGNDDVAALLEVGWVTLEAFAGVAKLRQKPTKISYGPLAYAAESPDVVLLRVNPRQMMEIGDAVTIELSGKPQCQILPRAKDQKTFAASMGCALSRARTGMSDEELTMAFPGERLAELVTALRPIRHADDAVSRF